MNQVNKMNPILLKETKENKLITSNPFNKFVKDNYIYYNDHFNILKYDIQQEKIVAKNSMPHREPLPYIISCIYYTDEYFYIGTICGGCFVFNVTTEEISKIDIIKNDNVNGISFITVDNNHVYFRDFSSIYIITKYTHEVVNKIDSVQVRDLYMIGSTNTHIYFSNRDKLLKTKIDYTNNKLDIAEVIKLDTCCYGTFAKIYNNDVYIFHRSWEHGYVKTTSGNNKINVYMPPHTTVCFHQDKLFVVDRNLNNRVVIFIKGKLAIIQSINIPVTGFYQDYTLMVTDKYIVTMELYDRILIMGEYFPRHYTNLPQKQKEKIKNWRRLKSSIHKDIKLLFERELLI